jgi:hypothetical protein
MRMRSAHTVFTKLNTLRRKVSLPLNKNPFTVALAFLVCCAAVGPSGCTTGLQPQTKSIGPSGTAVAGIAIGVGAAVVATVVLVHHSHHTMKGCALSGPNGLQLQTDGDRQIYALAGDTSGIKAGDIVRLAGKRKKKNSALPASFLVEKVSKDYGPCKISPVSR